MVEMCVGEDDGVDLGRIDGQGIPILRAVLAAALKKSAVDEHFATVDLDERLRPGDRPGSTDEREEHIPVVSPDHCGQQGNRQWLCVANQSLHASMKRASAGLSPTVTRTPSVP